MDRTRASRRFRCRRGLWALFERVAEEQERTVDDLVNEAMEGWAVAHGHPIPPDLASAPGRAEVDDEVTSQLDLEDQAATPVRGDALLFEENRTRIVAPRASSRDSGVSWTPLQAPRASGSGTHPAAPGRPLYLLAGDQRIRVDRDHFVIGRGSKVSDFVIKDANVSRQHAAIVRRDGIYHIQDLGSTNGIEYKGMRIDNKRIDEGDLFRICEHELRFSYRD